MASGNIQWPLFIIDDYVFWVLLRRPLDHPIILEVLFCSIQIESGCLVYVDPKEYELLLYVIHIFVFVDEILTSDPIFHNNSLTTGQSRNVK